jgi:EmrB/QacA subfamily drug resistance transporter
MAPNESTLDPHVYRIAIVVVVGSIMSILDATIVNVALETLGRDLNSTLADIQWVLTGYMLALGAVIPVTGWASRRFGSRNVYVFSLAVFTAGSALCGFAGSANQLILFRVIQGIGGGMLMPVGQMMIASAAGPQRMGRVMSITSIPTLLAPILGPTLGGLIVDNASWRWIFFVNLPVGVLALILALRILPRGTHGAAGRLDVIGLLLLAAGVPLVTYGLAEVGATGQFTTPKVVVPIFAGAALIALFVRHALHTTRPLLDLRLYRRPTFAAASVTMFCLSGAMFGGIILYPLYLQQIRGESAFHTGLLLIPTGLGMMLAMPLVGRLADRIGGGILTFWGMVVTTASTIPLGFIGAHTAVSWLSSVMLLRGIGLALAMMPAMTAAFASLKRSEISDATPQLNVLMRVGGSIGVAALAVVLQRALVGAAGLDAAASAYGTAFWWSAAICAVAIIPAFVLYRAEKAARASALEVEPRPAAEQLVETAA